MPLQNRVTPFGEIVAVPERGTMMGNRGILHDGRQRLRRRWASKLWICCLLELQGRREPVMAPGRYTRLFFLDEPTALAAGHRPCAYCRRGDYNAFRAAWADGNRALGLGKTPRAVEVDAVLHAERLGPTGAKRLHRASLERLPDGVFFTPEVNEQPDGRGRLEVSATNDEFWVGPRQADDEAPDPPALLLWRGTLWRWTPGGYLDAGPARAGTVLTLTPPSIVAALASGYPPGPPAGLG